MANTFAKFYSDLYSDGRPDDNKRHDENDAITKCDEPREDGEAIEQGRAKASEVDRNGSREYKCDHFPGFTWQQSQTVIDCLQRGKAGNTKRNQS